MWGQDVSKEVALHSLAKLQSEILVNRADKPINGNNKHVQTVFLIICPQEVVVHSVQHLYMRFSGWDFWIQHEGSQGI